MINFYDVFVQALANLISGLVTNVVWIILIFWAIKYIGSKLSDLIKHIPQWLDSWDKLKMKHYQIEKALEKR